MNWPWLLGCVLCITTYKLNIHFSILPMPKIMQVWPMVQYWLLLTHVSFQLVQTCCHTYSQYDNNQPLLQKFQLQHQINTYSEMHGNWGHLPLAPANTIAFTVHLLADFQTWLSFWSESQKEIFSKMFRLLFFIYM